MSERASSDQLECAIVVGAVSALDRRVAALRARANLGITLVDSEHGRATIISSEAAEALKLARDFEEIARDLEAGAS